MLATALLAIDPSTSYLVGSRVTNLGRAARWDRGARHIVIEADESDRTHLALTRSGAVVTNVEAEHLDRYGSPGAVVDAFVEFVRDTDGPVVLCADDPGARFVGEFVRRGSSAAQARVVYYGFDPRSDVRLLDARPGGEGMRVVADFRGRELAFEIGVGGLHNALNATGALALCDQLGYDVELAAVGLRAFRGTGRRFEDRGEHQGVRFIDDYAHHPTEVEATLRAAQQLGRRVVAVFQPHLFSRTRDNAAGFGAALAAADVAVVTDVFGAREAPIVGVDSGLVLDALRGAGADPATARGASRQELAEVVAELLAPGDLCLTLGAGDITTLPDEVLAVWERRRTSP
jgi:UDP-N-acetylmuramate--alanine ligase